MPAIKTAPHQKIVRINKAECSNKDIYAKINKSAMYEAIRNLNGRKASAFIIWCYLASNQDGFELALSNIAVLNAVGVKKDAYDTAIEILIEDGYLVKQKGNLYNFYEIPKDKKQD